MSKADMVAAGVPAGGGPHLEIKAQGTAAVSQPIHGVGIFTVVTDDVVAQWLAEFSVSVPDKIFPGAERGLHPARSPHGSILHILSASGI